MSFIEVYAHRNPAALSIELHFRSGKGTYCTIENGQLAVYHAELGELLPPALRLPIEAGDALVDELLKAGCRPTKTLPPDETIAAMRAHIGFAETVALQFLRNLSSGEGGNDRQQERARGVGSGDGHAPKGDE